jgi:WD40 repeat protein
MNCLLTRHNVVRAGVQGEVEKVMVVCTGRLYSMLLVDKKHVWVSAEDSIIRVYHATKYKKEKDLQSHRSMVRCMEVIRQPDDKIQVWSGDVEGNIIVWDPQVRMTHDSRTRAHQGTN